MAPGVVILFKTFWFIRHKREITNIYKGEGKISFTFRFFQFCPGSLESPSFCESKSRHVLWSASLDLVQLPVEQGLL